jgi:hypothetical protein
VALAGLQVQTSSYGLPIPVAYGLNRLTMNLIWYGDFAAVKQSSGGKSGKGNASGTYQYHAAVAGAICEGPVANTTAAWINQTAQASSSAGFLYFNGPLGQNPWSYLTAGHSTEAAPYSGIAYVAWPQLDLSSSATIPNVGLEIQALLYGTAPNGHDADPSLVIPDILSNPQYGAGFPAARIGSVVNNSEDYIVPGSGPFTITVGNHAAYDYNLDVEDGTGIPLICVSGAPGAGQYAFDAASGVYTFNGAQAGSFVQINYVSRGGLDDYRNFTLASGLVISPAYTNQTQISSLLDDIATFTYSEFVWSCGVLTLVPRASSAVSGSGYSFTPPANAGFDLTDDDYIAGGGGGSPTDDPVLVTRRRASDQINNIKIEYTDRANQYAPAIAEISDQALIDQYGRRAAPSMQAHIFSDGTAANVSAQLLLQKQYLLNGYSFAVDGRYAALDPMDIVTLTDSGLDLNKQAVRILDVTENDDGTLAFTAEEYPGGLGATAFYALNRGAGYVADYRVSPGTVNTPVIYEPPPLLLAANSANNPQIWIGVSGSDPNWGACQVYISLDNIDYQLLGDIPTRAKQGLTTAVLAAGSDPDTAHTLAVDLTESLGALAGVTQLNADNFIPACLTLVQNADGTNAELIAFEQATLTAAYKYDLGAHGGSAGYMRRGVYGTANASHASGSQFCLLDDNVFRFDLPLTPVSYVGKTLYLKFLSSNIYGGAQQSLADVTAITYDPTGAGIVVRAPTGIGVTMSYDRQNDGTIQSWMLVTWAASTDPLFDQYEVQYKPHAASWSSTGAVTSLLLRAGSSVLEIKPLQTGLAYDVRVRAIRSAGPAGGPFFSAWNEIDNQTTVGKTGTPNPPTSLVVTPGILLNRLTWAASPDSDIIGYLIYRYDYGSGAYLVIGKALTTTYIDQGLPAGLTQYYLVEALDTSGNPSIYISGNAIPLLIGTPDISDGAVTSEVTAFGWGIDDWIPTYVPGNTAQYTSPLIIPSGYPLTFRAEVTVGNAVNPGSNASGYPTLNGYPFTAPAQIILDVWRFEPFGTDPPVHVAGLLLALSGGGEYTDASTGVTCTNGVVSFEFQDTITSGGWYYDFVYSPYGTLTTGSVYAVPFSNFNCKVTVLKK